MLTTTRRAERRTSTQQGGLSRKEVPHGSLDDVAAQVGFVLEGASVAVPHGCDQG
jgi:hypothetical protein